MPVLTEAEWQRVERAYFAGRETVSQIAKRHGTSTTSIDKRRKKLGWPLHRDVKAALAAAGSRVDKAALIERIYRLIKLKLDQMEEDMTSSSERTPTDNERETRAIGTMIRNLEKARGIEQGIGSDGKQNDGGPERRAEEDALRRELAERLVRIREADKQNED